MRKNHVNSGPVYLGLTPAWAVPTAGGSGNSTRRSLSRWLAASGDANQDPDDTIEVQRRRPTGESSGPRERAEAPVRRKTDGGGAPPPPKGSSGGGYSRPPSGRPPGGGPPMKLNLRTLLVGGALLLFVFVIGPRFLAEGIRRRRRSRRSRRCSPNRHSRKNPAPALSPSQRSAAEGIAHGQGAQAGCNGCAGRGRCADC